jgi:hypothetical protein
MAAKLNSGIHNIPSMAEQFQFVKWYFMSKCESDWLLYFELVQGPAIQATQSIVMFDTLDVLRSIFRPAGNRRARHGRKSGKKRRRPRRNFPEISDLLGGPISEKSGLGGRQLTKGAQQLWILDGTMQKYLGRFLIVSIIGNIFYESAVLIAAHPDTDCGNARVRFEHDEQVMGIGFLAPTSGHMVYGEGGATAAFGSIFVPAPGWFLHWGCEVEFISPDGISDDEGECQIGIRIPIGGGEWAYEWSGKVSGKPGSGGSLSVTGFIPEGIASAELVGQSSGQWCKFKQLVGAGIGYN